MEGNNKKLFGQFGGQYVPETLMTALKQLEAGFEGIKEEKNFHKEYKDILKNYVGRPSSLYFAERLTKEVGGAKIYLKREDLNHTGAHKINNVIGQLLLAKKMGKKKVIAETGAGQHGVATATAAALFDMECTVFMGEEDIRRQKLNVFKMKLLGAKVEPVTSGTRTLKDATNEAIRQWVRDPDNTFYVIGSVVGPHPYPEMVGYFQQIIGEEVKSQLVEKEGRLPDAIVACVGGGSNAAGIFRPFLEHREIALYGVEAGGLGLATPYHAAALNKGSIGVLHGMKTYLCQDEHGQILPVHSISAGLDYPGIGPEHAYYHEEKRVQYPSITDQEALEGFGLLSKIEGIIPALESAHAVAYGVKLAKEMNQDQVLVINLSGRGDKDVEQVKDHLDKENLRGSKGITHVMSKAKAEGRKVFIPYVTVGDPTLEDTLQYVHAMVRGGADIIELGVPYSDPLADGPTIQQAAGRALANNISLKDVFSLVSKLRKKDISLPIVLLTYYNSIYAYGTERFAKDCRQYGVDGVVIPDLPFEERDEAYPLLKEQGIAPIPLLAPTSKERMKKIVASGEGFVYCVSSNGTTGERKTLDENIKKYLGAIKDVCDLPMAVGFGISSPDMAQAIAPYTEGIIVGSHIVNFIHQHQSAKALQDLIRSYKEVLN